MFFVMHLAEIFTLDGRLHNHPVNTIDELLPWNTVHAEVTPTVSERELT
jgi:hypothetical protein